MNTKTKMVRVGGNGHGYKKAPGWNMASFLPRRQDLALQSPSPDTATDCAASAANATPTQSETPPAVSILSPHSLPEAVVKEALALAGHPNPAIVHARPSPLDDLNAS